MDGRTAASQGAGYLCPTLPSRWQGRLSQGPAAGHGLSAQRVRPLHRTAPIAAAAEST